MNYRQIYSKHHKQKIKKNWHIHHIDANIKNNKIENLIALPAKLHLALHNYIGLLPRKELEIILKWFLKKIRNKMSTSYLEYKLKKEVAKLNLCQGLIRKNKLYIKNKKIKYENYLKSKKSYTRLNYWDYNNENWIINISEKTKIIGKGRERIKYIECNEEQLVYQWKNHRDNY